MNIGGLFVPYKLSPKSYKLAYMKVAILTPVFPPYGGGMGVVAYHHAKILAQAGFAVTVVTPDFHRPPLRATEFTLVEVATALRLGNAAVLRGAASLLDGFDLLALHHPFVGFARSILRRRTGQRLVVHYHMDLLAPGWRGLVLRTWQRRVLPMLMDAASHVTVLSYDYAREGLLGPWLKRQPAKFSELPNGVDVARFSPGSKEPALVERLGLEARRVVVFVGSMDAAHYFKGVAVLLAALARLPDDVVAVLVGSGNLLSRYQALAGRLGLAARARFVGSVPADELPWYYRCADVVVLPSVTRSEAFGLVLLEAMACGKPTVASALPGVRTVVADGVTGLLSHPGNAQDLAAKISFLLEEPQCAAAYGQAGRQRAVTQYAWPEIGKRVAELYQTLLTRT